MEWGDGMGACLRLQYKLSRVRISGDIGGETDSAGAFTRRVLTPGNQAVYVLQQLRLTGAWISTQQYVQLSPEYEETLVASHSD